MSGLRDGESVEVQRSARLPYVLKNDRRLGLDLAIRSDAVLTATSSQAYELQHR